MAKTGLDIADLSHPADWQAAEALLARYGLVLERVADGEPIPGSHWGEREAGLVGACILARRETPIHSLLHETCHAICMDPERRAALHTDAGGDDLEEEAVCYLSILLATEIAGFSSDRMLADMDAWGYSFRLGNARAWFESDADDARCWLLDRGLIDPEGCPTFRLRGTGPAPAAAPEAALES